MTILVPTVEQLARHAYGDDYIDELPAIFTMRDRHGLTVILDLSTGDCTFHPGQITSPMPRHALVLYSPPPTG